MSPGEFSARPDWEVAGEMAGDLRPRILIGCWEGATDFLDSAFVIEMITDAQCPAIQSPPRSLRQPLLETLLERLLETNDQVYKVQGICGLAVVLLLL